MKKNNTHPNTATGKTAMDYIGSAVVNGNTIPLFTFEPTSIRDMIETLCDVCIDSVKKGTAAYVYDRFSIDEFDFGVGISFYTINGGLYVSLHTRSTMKSDLSEVRNKWGEYITSYIRKRGLEGNKSFAKKVKSCEVSPYSAAILTSGFFEGNLGVNMVA